MARELILGNPSDTDHATETTYITQWGSSVDPSGGDDFNDQAFSMGDTVANKAIHGFMRIEMPEKPFEDSSMEITNVELRIRSENLGTPTALTLYLINYPAGVLDYDNMSWANYSSSATWETGGATGETDIDKSTNYGLGNNGKIVVGTLAHNAHTSLPLTGLVRAKKLDWGKTIDLAFHYTPNSDSSLDTYNVQSPTYAADVNERPYVIITYKNDVPTSPIISVTPQENGIDTFVNITNKLTDADLTKLITCWNNGTSVAVTNNPNEVNDTGIEQLDSTNTTHLDAGVLATENSAYSFAVFSCDDDVDNPTTNAGVNSSNVVTIKRPDVSTAVLYTDSACTSALGAGADNVSIGQELYLKVVGTGGDFGGKCGAVLVNWDSGTSDADDKYSRYEFTSSDTTSTNQVTIKHQFSKEGGFAVKVQVEDPKGFRSDKTAITGEPVDVGATDPVAVIKCSKTKVLNAKFADQDSGVLLTGSGSYAIGSNRKIKRYEWVYDAEKSISSSTHPTVVTSYATDNDNTVFDKSSSKIALADFEYGTNLGATVVKVYGLISKAEDGSNVVDTADTFSHYEYGVASLSPYNNASFAGAYGSSSSEFFKTVEIVVGNTIDAEDTSNRYTLAATTVLDSGTDLDEGSNITNSVTNFTVDDGSKFSVGDEIKLDSEVMLVTKIVTNELYVHRGWAHTTAATHNDGVDIYITNRKINTNLRFIDSDAQGIATAKQLQFGGFTYYQANDGSGCTFTASANSITMVNVSMSNTTGAIGSTTTNDWFKVGYRIGDTISVGSTTNNGTDAVPATHIIRDISDTAGGSVLYDVITVDSITDDETVAAKIIKSDKFLSPLSVAIYDAGAAGEVTNIQLHAYDDSSFYGTASTSSVNITTVEPSYLDLNSVADLAITDYNITRSGGINPEMPLGSRRYPVGNTRVSLGLPQLTMNVRVMGQSAYRQIYNLIEGDSYDFVFFSTDQVDSSTAYRQLKLQIISGSIQKSPDHAGQYTANLVFSILGEQVE